MYESKRLNIKKEANGKEKQLFLGPAHQNWCPYYIQKRCMGPPWQECWKCELTTVKPGMSCLQCSGESTWVLGPMQRYSTSVPTKKHLPLPPFIPQIAPYKLKKEQINKLGGWLSVSLKDVITTKGTVIFRDSKDILSKMNLPQHIPLILNCSTKEYLIERLWDFLNGRNLLVSLSNLGFKAVLTPNFSLCAGSARCTQIAALSKCYKAFQDMVNVGMVCIPPIDVISKNDKEQLISWLNKMPEINTGYLTTQLLKNDKRTFAETARNTEEIVSRLARPFNLVWVGPCSADRIKDIFKSFPQSTIVSSKPFFAGRAGRVLRQDSLTDEKKLNVSCAEAIVNYIRGMREIVENTKKRQMQKQGLCLLENMRT